MATPTVQVRKKDGTIVSMTMEEFALYRKNNPPSANPVLQGVQGAAALRSTEGAKQKQESEGVGGKEKKPATAPVSPTTLSRPTPQQESDRPIKSRSSKKTEQVREQKEKKQSPPTTLGFVSETHLATTSPVPHIFEVEALVHQHPVPQRVQGTAPLHTAEDKGQGRASAQRKEEGNAASTGRQEIKREQPATKKAWAEEDHLSPLTETLGSGTAFAPKKEELALEPLLAGLSFSIAPALFHQLGSLITSRKKGVRSDAQVEEAVVRARDAGGLGLLLPQAEELIAAIHERYSIPPERAPFRARKTTGEAPRAQSSIDRGERSTEISAARPRQEGEMGEREERGLRTGSTRPVLHDIVPVRRAEPLEERHTMGPLEELAQMDLIDFRRFAATPEGSVAIVHGKLLALRKESELAFLEGSRAWFQSPLYTLNQGLILRSVEEGVPLDDILISGGSDMLTRDEFQALLSFHSELGL